MSEFEISIAFKTFSDRSRTFPSLSVFSKIIIVHDKTSGWKLYPRNSRIFKQLSDCKIRIVESVCACRNYRDDLERVHRKLSEDIVFKKVINKGKVDLKWTDR